MALQIPERPGLFAAFRQLSSFRQSAADVSETAPVADEIPGADKRIHAGNPPLKVFIVGPARSGTSIMFFAMSRIMGLPGFGESHVMPVFQKTVYNFRLSVEKFRNVEQEILIKSLKEEEFEPFLFNFVRGFYVQAHGSQSWVDKTPTDEATHGLPLIERIFPEARILAMKRTGVEVVNSYMKKFNSPFKDACAVWRNSMEGIKMSRALCKNVLEIDQYDLINDPVGTARKLSEHLGQPDFAERLGIFFATERVEKSSTHDPRHRLRLADVEWTDEQKEFFLSDCAKTMEAFDYPF